ncbi:trigger factor family protein [Candidatus Parcubacteria bacterium]|nr:trigger factor family protein [Candidatus Parcubacteria bacterium]
MPPKPAEKHSHKHFEGLKLEMLPDGEAQITGELTLPFLAECRTVALKALTDRIEIPGFRKGHIPESALTKHLGEMRILEEAAEVGLAEEYGHIITELKLSPIGRPHIAVTKLAPGIPLEFKILVPLEPELTLPDYKKVAKEVPKSEFKDDAKEEEKFWAREKRRAAILDAIVKATDIKLPKILRENENKSKAELILLKIAEAEKIEPTPEELEAEALHILKHHPEADPLRARLYVYQLLRNTKVLEFLETL